MKARYFLFLSISPLLIFYTNCSQMSTSGSPPAPVDSGSFVAGIDKQIEFDMTQIEDAGYAAVDTQKTGFITIASVNYAYKFFRNKAYKCGQSGYYTFLVLQKGSLDNDADHWVFQHGGGVGFCYIDKNTGAKLCNDDKSLMEESADEILNQIQSKAFSKNGPKKTIMGNRIAEGYRVVAPSMCDHDLYAGFGTEFPNNPHWGGEPQTVDGLLATMAAVTYAAKNFNYTGHTYLHGGSAGSAGAYHLSMGLLNNGIRVNGAVLDSMTLGVNRIFLDEKQCTPTAQNAISIGFTPAEADLQIGAKIGLFANNMGLALESQLGQNGIHYFIVDGQEDQFCCGNAAALREVTTAGFNNNCDWYYQVYKDKLAQDNKTISKVLVVPGLGHGVAGTIDAENGTDHQAQMEAWFQSILASGPPQVLF